MRIHTSMSNCRSPCPLGACLHFPLVYRHSCLRYTLTKNIFFYRTYMDIKDTEKLYRTDNILLADSNYYKYVFKKTEKIVCTVLYLIGHADKGHDEMSVMSLKEAAHSVLNTALATLSCRTRTAHDQLYTVITAFVALESKLRVAQAIALIREEIIDILSLEIDTVLRMIRQYLPP